MSEQSQVAQNVPESLIQTGEWTDVSENFGGRSAAVRIAHSHDLGQVNVQIVEARDTLNLTTTFFVNGLNEVDQKIRNNIQGACAGAFFDSGIIACCDECSPGEYMLIVRYMFYVDEELRSHIPLPILTEKCTILLDQMAMICWGLVNPIADYLNNKDWIEFVSQVNKARELLVESGTLQ